MTETRNNGRTANMLMVIFLTCSQKVSSFAPPIFGYDRVHHLVTVSTDNRYCSSHTRIIVDAHLNMGTADVLEHTVVKDLYNGRKEQKFIPIFIFDAMLPKQRLLVDSTDHRFEKLTEFLSKGNIEEFGVIGYSPHTGQPLNFGVTVSISDQSVVSSLNKDGSDSVELFIQGDKRFEIQGELWMDDTQSFYFADIEIVDDRSEELNREQETELRNLAKTVPQLVEQWLALVIETGKSDKKGMESLMMDIGQLPDENYARAFWIGALINPQHPLGVSVDVRHALLSCKNDFHRMKLATVAIQSSIDHLSGKQLLF